MSTIKNVEEIIKNHIINAGYNIESVILVPSSRKELGQYQVNNAFSLAKENHTNPMEIANKIKEELDKDSIFTNVNVAGGFVNISFSNEFYLENLNKMLEDIDFNIDKESKKTIFMDYGGANIAKTLHVGHLRPADIGEAIKRLTLKLGVDVIADVHFGDIGRQSGMVIYEMRERVPELNYFRDDYDGNGDPLPITEKDLEEIYPVATAKAKENEEVMDEVHRICIELEMVIKLIMIYGIK